ncbi:MAG: ABC transporter substrate-binding protein [Janthinobacterium lividum]
MTVKARPTRPGSRAVRTATAFAGGLALVATAACSVSTPQTGLAQPVPVELTADLPGQLTIGVEVTLTSAPGEGAEWRDAAEGAVVAARRFALGGTKITLVAVNDKGTSEGATAAVKALAGQDVAAIIVATDGDHVAAGLAEAAADQIPVLMPYDLGSGGVTGQVWSTGPGRQATDTRLVATMADRHLDAPLLVDAGGGPVTGLTPREQQTYAAGGDAAALATGVARRQRQLDTAVDSIVVSGAPELQAAVVAALQGSSIDVPILLTPQALSPAFPAALTQAGGSLSGQLSSAGLDEGDATALEATDAGRSLAAYFSGLQLAADDPATKDLAGDRPFADVAAAADVSSHDAVVAVVRAAVAAKSTQPAQVAQALPGLRLGSADGVAGPPLDFSSTQAVGEDAVVPLASTAVSPGVRPPSDAPTLFWFDSTHS